MQDMTLLQSYDIVGLPEEETKESKQVKSPLQGTENPYLPKLSTPNKANTQTFIRKSDLVTPTKKLTSPSEQKELQSTASSVSKGRLSYQGQALDSSSK